MTREEYINKVRAKLEEISPFQEPESFIASEGDADYENVKPINVYIEDCLDQSSVEVLNTIPSHLIDKDMVSNNGTMTIDDGVGKFDLPDDFLRLVSLKADDWEKDVVSPISRTNPLYSLQKCKYTRGGVSKPVVAIVGESDGKYAELYSVSSEKYKLTYIPKLKPENVNSDISEYIILLCAIKVLTIFNQSTDKLTEQFNSLINQHTL